MLSIAGRCARSGSVKVQSCELLRSKVILDRAIQKQSHHVSWRSIPASINFFPMASIGCTWCHLEAAFVSLRARLRILWRLLAVCGCCSMLRLRSFAETSAEAIGVDRETWRYFVTSMVLFTQSMPRLSRAEHNSSGEPVKRYTKLGKHDSAIRRSAKRVSSEA